MILLHWGYRKARVWLDELPDWNCKYEDVQTVEHLWETADVKFTHPLSAAIELLVPIGARSYYGALGAELMPTCTKQLTVQVPLSHSEGQVISDALPDRRDTVYAGFPREYLPGVLKIVENQHEMQFLGSGILRFSCAAHGSLGSSSWFFGVLSSIVIKLLLLDRETASQELLIELVQAELRNDPIQKRSKD